MSGKNLKDVKDCFDKLRDELVVKISKENCEAISIYDEFVDQGLATKKQEGDVFVYDATSQTAFLREQELEKNYHCRVI